MTETIQLSKKLDYLNDIQEKECTKEYLHYLEKAHEFNRVLCSRNKINELENK